MPICKHSKGRGAPALKTITFACVHFTVAFGVAYLLTGSLVIGGVIAVVEPLCNTIAYYFHEKIWSFYRSSPAKSAKMEPESFGHDKLSDAAFPERQ